MKNVDEWVEELDISNVMQLNPMNLSELESDLHNLHELQRDPIYEKLVLLVVTYFTMATECRLLKLEGAQEWLSKAVYFGCKYLPRKCPLVDYCIESY